MRYKLTALTDVEVTADILPEGPRELSSNPQALSQEETHQGEAGEIRVSIKEGESRTDIGRVVTVNEAPLLAPEALRIGVAHPSQVGQVEEIDGLIRLERLE
jgi:hypothetical protein